MKQFEIDFSNMHDVQPAYDFNLVRNFSRKLVFMIWVVYSTIMECSSSQGTFGIKLIGVIRDRYWNATEARCCALYSVLAHDWREKKS